MYRLELIMKESNMSAGNSLQPSRIGNGKNSKSSNSKESNMAGGNSSQSQPSRIGNGTNSKSLGCSNNWHISTQSLSTGHVDGTNADTRKVSETDDGIVPSKAPCTKKGVVEALPDSVVKISARKILCRTHNGAEFLVDYFLLTQSKSFVRQWEKALEKKKKKNGHSKKFVFRLPECINTSLFRDVISWLEAHDGTDEPVDRIDPETGERIWYDFNDFETNFFNIGINKIAAFCEIGRQLEITQLYKYSCQTMAKEMQTRSAEQIREIFDLPNDLDSSDIAAIQRSQRRRRMHAIRLAKSAAIDQAKHEALLRYLGMDQLQISNTISKHDGCSSNKHDGCSSSAAITSKGNATNN